MVQYERQAGMAFDLIYFQTNAIFNASQYIPGAAGGDAQRKFYIDIFSTAPICTVVLLQMETLPLAQDNDYPTGRRARLRCPTNKSGEWERVMCTFFDEPDPSVGDTEVTHLVLFFAPGDINNNFVYYFRNFDVAVSGCTSNCEPATEDTCAGNIDGEQGQCNDNVDNDFDTKTDCADPNCITDPICTSQLSSSLALASDRSVGAANSPFNSQSTHKGIKLAALVTVVTFMVL